MNVPHAGLLGVILMNPPTGSGGATTRHLQAACQVLACRAYQVVNLLPVPTRSVSGISEAGRTIEVWHAARPALRELIHEADELLLGWGLGGGFGGVAREHFRDQTCWIRSEIARKRSDPLVWTVGNEPRHPSRWHQYVSDRHERTQGGDFPTRLRRVLVKSDGRISTNTPVFADEELRR